MMRKLVSVSAAALMLASCGSGHDGTVQTGEGDVGYDIEQSGDGSEVTVTAEDGSEVVSAVGTGEAELPDGFSIYPGATVISSTTVTQADGGGALILMQSDATPAEMVSFYRQQAEAAGIEIQMNADVNGSSMLGGEGAGGMTFSFSASPNGDGTSGQLIVGAGSGG